jgi:hypothetical protein
MFSLNLGNKGGYTLGINMPFNNANGSLIKEKEGGEEYKKPVNFVIEVKTGETIQNFVKGFNQAVKKAAGIKNSVPVVAIDHDAYMRAISESTGFKAIAEKFIKDNGGRLMLIGGLNERAQEVKQDAVDETRKGQDIRTIPSATNRP